MWGPLLRWLKEDGETMGLFAPKDMHNFFHSNETGKVIHFIRTVHEDRKKMEHVCVTYGQYRVNLT